MTVNGYVSVENTGTAPATIGNIVVNLQRRCSRNSTSWGSASVDLADAFHGDAAITDEVVAAATQESTSKCHGTDYANNTPKNGVGTFSENPGSGSLSFTDADNNTTFSITPQVTIAPGNTINLLYQANFNGDWLVSTYGIAAGTSLRTETIVTFGNAGGRGGSGASLAKVDIDGSGNIECPATQVCTNQADLSTCYTSNECWVRSVPARTSLPLVPATFTCNDSVTLSDLSTADNPAVTSGSASFDPSTFTTDIGEGSGIQPVNSGGTFNVGIADVLGGNDGGVITNCADLSSPDVQQPVYDPFGNLIGTFTVCKGVETESCGPVSVPKTGGPTPPPPPPGPFCTYQQSLWGNPNKPDPSAALNALTFPITLGGTNTMEFTSAIAVQDYLPAGGTPGALTTGLVDPTSSSSGHFGGEALALELNVLSNPGFADLTLCNLTNTEVDFNGMTVNDVLSAANAVLGGAPITTTNPGDYQGYDTLLQHLNVSYQQCNETGFAKNHLVSGNCP